MDVYSNVLYVQINQPELAQLAHKAIEVDKYRVETCCIIGCFFFFFIEKYSKNINIRFLFLWDTGNYYGLRGQHEKAVLYLQRALKLNPHYAYAWTIMGHENIEMKNSNAAIACYRKATGIGNHRFHIYVLC